MSIAVMSWVWNHSTVEGGSELLVLLAMADWADDDGANIFPSISRIAKKTRLSERQVQRQLAELESGGHLIREREGGAGPGSTARWRIVRGDNMSPIDLRVTSTTPKGDIHDAKRVTPMSPDPSSYPSVDPSLIAPPSNNQKRSRHRSKSEIPTNFTLSDQDKQFADERAVAWKIEFARFVNYHQGKGSMMVDWHAAWRTWVLNQEKWNKERDAKEDAEPDHGVPSVAELIKRWNGNAK